MTLMASMTDEDRKQDEGMFAGAIGYYNLNAKSPLLNNQANREFARLKASQTYTYLKPQNPFSVDVYAAMIVRYAAEMEHEAPVAPKVRQRDDSGDKRNNPHRTDFGGNILAAQEAVGKTEKIERELYELRMEERFGFPGCTPKQEEEKKARITALLAAKDEARGSAPIAAKAAAALEPLPLDAAGQVLKDASPAQLKELLKRRREEGWVAPE